MSRKERVAKAKRDREQYMKGFRAGALGLNPATKVSEPFKAGIARGKMVRREALDSARAFYIPEAYAEGFQ